MNRVLLYCISIIFISSCSQNFSKKAVSDKNSDVIKQSLDEIKEKDEYVLSKLWSSADFRNKKEYRYRNLEDAYLEPDSVINLAVYSGFNGKIPENIDVFKNVQLIGMNNNDLTALPESIGNLLFLQEVHMNKNLLAEFPQVLTNNRYLKTILLSDNKIETITPDIKNLLYLENLVLNDNQINALPPELFELNNLKVLGLRNNGLNELPDKFGQLAKLEKLNLQNNNIKELPASLLNACNNLERITLRGNPMSSSYVKELREKMPNTEVEF